MKKLPELTNQPILFIDGTPNKDYSLRILRAYRQLCNCRWGDTANGTDTENPLLKLMNEHCRQRAEILDKAITTLEAANH